MTRTEAATLRRQLDPKKWMQLNDGTPIIPAMLHHFGAEMACRCGMDFNKHQLDPHPCPEKVPRGTAA